MNKIYLFLLLKILVSCDGTYCNCNEITKVYIENRAVHRFGGIKQLIIEDKLQIQKLCNEVSLFNIENNIQTRPYIGTILITFVYSDREGREFVENKYTTAIIFKENENFISNSRGQFYDNIFVEKILKYLKISRFTLKNEKFFNK